MNLAIQHHRFTVDQYEQMIRVGYIGEDDNFELIRGEIVEKNCAALTRHRFTVDQYEEMVRKGFLSENDRVELIHGEIIQKMTIGSLHAACVRRINRWLSLHLTDQVILGIQDPIKLADSEPEPDVCLLRRKDGEYEKALPTAADVLLIIEVADSSIEWDREVKGRLYAQNGIPEYWLVNLRDHVVEVYRSPEVGVYQSQKRVGLGEAISPIYLSDLSFPVDRIFQSAE